MCKTNQRSKKTTQAKNPKRSSHDIEDHLEYHCPDFVYHLPGEIKYHVYNMMSTEQKSETASKVPEILTSHYEVRNKDVVVMIKKTGFTVPDAVRAKYGNTDIKYFDLSTKFSCRKLDGPESKAAIKKLRKSIKSCYDQLSQRYQSGVSSKCLLNLVFAFDMDSRDVYHPLEFYLQINDLFQEIPHSVEILKAKRPFCQYTKSKDGKTTVLEGVFCASLPTCKELGKSDALYATYPEVVLNSPIQRSTTGEVCRTTKLFECCDLAVKRSITSMEGSLKQISIVRVPNFNAQKNKLNVKVNRVQQSPETRLKQLNTKFKEFITRPEVMASTKHKRAIYQDFFLTKVFGVNYGKLREFLHQWDASFVCLDSLQTVEDWSNVEPGKMMGIRMITEIYDTPVTEIQGENLTITERATIANNKHKSWLLSKLSEALEGLFQNQKMNLPKSTQPDLIVETLTIFDNRNYLFLKDTDQYCENEVCLKENGYHILEVKEFGVLETSALGDSSWNGACLKRQRAEMFDLLNHFVLEVVWK
ncbi:hypothetical protein WICPIJ_002519 [Wickerhamomyces pijperi]|uniref:Uncharacterized protein n=1 Tax=Wickerhamomyces pijperi TaxID=599730 RepID=A0A9P8QBJ4_WICPI|nr:hypothetical protein WICPIJ_002519 [Wickerhamomyces pijperi]